MGKNDGVAKLELALASILNPDVRSAPLRTLPILIMKATPDIKPLSTGGVSEVCMYIYIYIYIYIYHNMYVIT